MNAGCETPTIAVNVAWCGSWTMTAPGVRLADFRRTQLVNPQFVKTPPSQARPQDNACVAKR